VSRIDSATGTESNTSVANFAWSSARRASASKARIARRVRITPGATT
jgi:hypothetical protein